MRHGYRQPQNFKRQKRNYSAFADYESFKSRSSHPDHPIRDTMFAVLACFVTLGLGGVFIGISLGYVPAIIAGAALVLVEFVTSIICLVKTIIRFS